MTTNTKTIVWFDAVGKNDVPLVGGKGANLGELLRAQIPVPPGFIVSTETYRQFLREGALLPSLREHLHNLDIENSTQLQQAAIAAQRTITEATMSASIRAEITQAYRQLGEGLVAVRSSATAEDLAEASFAGQQATFLNVEGAEDVLDAVQRCWASLFEARAIFYRAQVGWDHLSVDLAVPVQRMVQSECSGVMFTVEPIRNDPTQIVIETVYGLGEAIVSGQVTPDHYAVAKESLEIVTAEIATQDQQMIRNPHAQPGENANIWVSVSPDQRSRPKLTSEQIQELARIGLKVEQHYGRPQDIEWAWANGTFLLLQSRPVTTTAAPQETEAAPTVEEPLLLSGSPASPGIGTGIVRVILDPANAGAVQPGDILVATMTTPDFVPAMKRAAAIITEKGGRTCHAAIISRELGVPCVVGVATATAELNDDTAVTVNGSNGHVYAGRIEPLIAWWERSKVSEVGAAVQPTRTRIYVNLAEPELAEVVAQRSVDGVGLLRAEFMIAQIGEHPRSFVQSGRQEEFIEKLSAGIRTIVAAFAPRLVIYRATDFKTNEYANLKGGTEFEPQEENPMIGYRGAARYVREPDLFALEMEAITRIRREYSNLSLMIPFVRTTTELRQVLQLVEESGLRRGADFQIWMMTEVPSNVFLLDEFINEGIDGISIGSNDLTQLVLGIDRDNERFAEEFDERDPAVLKALEWVISTAKRRGITVSICGQGPSEHPDLTERLVRWGITSVSVTPDMIEKTRRLVADAEAQIGD